MPETAKASSPQPCLLKLPEALDLKAAAPLAAEFLALRGRPVQVDGRQVTRVGGLCLQVLLSAAKTWKADESRFSIVSPSSELIDGLLRLGVSTADFTCQDKSE